jgi:glucan phosphoethanolaminetransferase (alkaline phosphatase superfamily)
MVSPRISPLAFATTCAALYTAAFYGITLVPVEFSASYAYAVAWRLMYAFSNVLAVFLCLNVSQVLFVLGVPLLLVTSAAVAYLRFKFNIIVTSDVVGALFETDLSEAREFLDAGLAGWVALAAAAAGAVCWVYVRACWQKFEPRRDVLRLYLLAAFVITFLFVSLNLDIAPPSELEYLKILPFAALVLVFLWWRGRPSRPPPGRVLHAAMLVGLVATSAFVLLSYGKAEAYWKVLCAVALASAMLDSIPAGRPRGGRRQPLAHAVAACLSLVPGLTSRETSTTFLPTNVIQASAYYISDRALLRQARQERFDVASLPSSIDETRADSLVVVVIIGESARADHCQLNGYARATTPELARRTDLVSYPKVRSCAAGTRVSVPCLMTRATENSTEVSLDETSLVTLFRKHGFVTTWISNNQMLSRHDTPITVFAREANFQVFPSAFADADVGRHDETMLPVLSDTLAARTGRQLVVLHQRGSHWHYAERYPPTFERFVPACKHGTPPYLCERKALVNAYDNSIAYTDYFLARVIELVGDRNALLLYVSDHGQSLGEDGFFTHGDPERAEQRHVPMIWWTSEKFRRRAPEAVAALTRRRGDPVSHDHVFHSVLGCAGIRGEAIDPALDLCRTN